MKNQPVLMEELKAAEKSGFYFFLLDRLCMFAKEHLQPEPYHRFCVLVDSIRFDYW